MAKWIGVSNMKKETKKKKKFKLKTKWKTWMTIASVFAGVFLVSGSVVLGVFLSGGFNEKIIYQQGFTNQYVLSEPSLYNTQTGQIEVKDNFKITLPLTDSEVTKKTVTVDFVGSEGKSDGLEDGWRGNGSIAIPEEVTLGVPFEVKILSKTYQDENGEEFTTYAGGISKIRFAYEDISQSTFDLDIAVDVPVYKTVTYLANAQGEKLVDEGGHPVTTVIKEEEFYVMTEFYPKDSQYLYSDNKRNINEASKRKKMSFYEYEGERELVATNYSTSVDDKDKISFTAGDRMAENVIIKSYTFKNAKDQLDFLASSDIDEPETYYRGALGYFSTLNGDYAGSELNFTIGEASIGHFEVGKAGTTIDVDAGIPFQLFVQGDAGHEPNLFTNVYSTSGDYLNNLLKDIALRFYVGDEELAPDETDSLVIGNNGGKITIDGIDYYRPYSAPNSKDYKLAYWGLTSTKVQSIKVEIYLLVKDRSEIFTSATGEPQVKQVTLNVREHEELPISWKDGGAERSPITVILNHDASGDIIRETINLSEYVINPETNVYRDAVFFAYFEDVDEKDEAKLAELKEKANAIIGADGYIAKYSGKYVTQGGDRYLFAINGSNLTLSQTCEITLYYGIQKGEAENGLYDVVMCDETKSVVCREALYANSIILDASAVDTQLFPPMNGEVSINQGSISTISVIFTIRPESFLVFKDEFQKVDLITLVVKDNIGNDVSDYLVIDDGTLSQEENNSGKIDDGIRLASFELVYNNAKDEPIVWKLDAQEKIVVYRPKAKSITIESNDTLNLIGNNGIVNVKQVLNSLGMFETTINIAGRVGEPYPTIAAFIDAIVGERGAGITITDQKGKTNTLSGQWKFVPIDDSNSVIAISDDGKSFSFKSGEKTAALCIRSVDDQAEIQFNGNLLKINFNITSQGITKVISDNETKTYETQVTSTSTSVGRVDLRKYGAKGENGEKIELRNLIKFKTTNSDNIDEDYNNFSFRFNPQYYSAIVEDEILISLFGEDGMLTLYNNGMPEDFNGSYSAENIRSTLQSLNDITGIVIKKNFYTTHTLQFIIFDTVGAVNTVFNLELLPNLSVGNENYTEYAGEENKFELKNQYENYNKEEKGNFYSLFSEGIYYILNQNGSYELVKYNTKPSGAVGVFEPNNSEGKQIYFYDFWEGSSRGFEVYFRPEGNNRFALNLPIKFEVERDIKIVDQNKKFYILSSEAFTVASFVKVVRHKDQEITGVPFSYEFGDYLEIAENTGIVTQSSDVIVFDYNIKTIETKLTIKYGTTVLGEIPIYIELYQSDEDIYELIASKLRKERVGDDKNPDKVMPTARVQRFGEGEDQVDYIVVDLTEGTYWQFYEDVNDEKYKTDNGIESWPINPVHTKYGGGDTFLRDYVYKTETRSKGPVIQFLSQQDLIYGLNNESVLLSLRFLKSGASVELAYMYIPLIISGVGYNSVVYDASQLKDETRALESALSKPEDLIADGIYNEIKAGQVTKILTGITNNDSNLVPGLYYLKDQNLDINLATYSIATNVTENYLSLVKTIGNPTEEGTILLNHLATSTTKNVYIALEYRVRKVKGGSASNTQVFYYLMKVVPDLIVEDPLYAYKGDTEYITGKINENLEINLEQTFDATTLSSGLKRFMYSKDIALESQDKSSLQALVKSKDGATIRLTMDITTKDSHNVETTTHLSKIVKLQYNESEEGVLTEQDVDVKAILSPSTLANGQIVNVTIIEGDVEISYNDVLELATLKAENKVVSVQPSTMETPYYSQEQWNDIVAISFGTDNNTMIIRPLKDETMTIVINHSYTGGSDGQLSVVDGDRTFTFVLNEKQQTYAVRFKDGSNTQQTSEFKKNFKNGSAETIELSAELLSVSGGSGSSSGTFVPGILQIECTSGIENLDRTEHEKGFEFDNMTGIMTIYLKDYIDQDKQVIFTLFTKQGYLAQIVLNLEANVVYSAQSPKKSDAGKAVDVPELKAGLEYDLTKLISLENDIGKIEDLGTDENSLYIIEKAEIDDETKNFVKIEGGKIKVANLLEDKTFKVDYKIKFTSETFGGVGNEFVFSQTYKILHNISTPASVTKTVPVIAGDSHQINIADLSEIISTDDEYSEYGTGTKFTNVEISTLDAYPAFKELKKTGGNYTIETNYISAGTPLTLTLSITAKQAGFADQSYSLNYTISIAPSVELGVTYPDPSKPETTLTGTTAGRMKKESSDTEMKYEILESNLTYINGQYLSDGTSFDNIVKFLYSSPTFAYNSASSRLNIFNAIKPKEGDTEVKYENEYILGSTWTNSGVLDLTQLRVTIETLENAEVTTGAKGAEQSLATSSTIDLNSRVTFKAGKAYGVPSIIVLNITYKNVSITYTIRMQDNAVKLERILPSENTLTDKKPNSPTEEIVTYENIYLDRTSTANLLSEGRILHAEMLEESLNSLQGDYYFVFSDKTNYYASYPIYIKNDMQAKTIDFDLGVGMGDMEFYGAYLTSTLENKKIAINTEADNKGHYRQLYISGDSGVKQMITQETNGDLFKDGVLLKDYVATLFKSTIDVQGQSSKLNIYTTSRVQLQYGVNENNVPFLVNYRRYGNKLINSDYKVKDNLGIINDNGKNGNILKSTSLLLSNGAEDATVKDLALNYYYMLSIDVDVEKKATNAHGFIEVNVSQTYSSIVKELGITHPFAGRAVTASDFTSTGTELSFKTLYLDNTDTYSAIKATYPDMTEEQFNIIHEYFAPEVLNISAFRRFVGQTKTNRTEDGTQDNIYLFQAATENANDNIYDYEIIPYGAKNAGDYVLGQIQYSIDETHKTTFYVVFKIVPDYLVTFEGSTGKSTIEQENGVDKAISNIDNPLLIKNTSDNVYTKFILTANGTGEGYVSVKHTKGSASNNSTERSVSAFKITMPLDETVESITYNNASNMGAKIFYNHEVTNGSNPNLSNWKDIKRKGGDGVVDDALTGNLTYDNEKGPVTFTNVEVVVFGDQYYMIEAEDHYGFIYRVYFVLGATKETPSIANKIMVVENGLLDFGVTYQQLSISTTVDESNTKIDCAINSTLQTPSQNGDVSLLVLNGINAWQFDKDYTNADAVKIGSVSGALLASKADGEAGYNQLTEFDMDPEEEEMHKKLYNIVFSGDDLKYFKASDIENIEIVGVKFYTLTGQLVNADEAGGGGNLLTVGGANSSNDTLWVGTPAKNPDESTQSVAGLADRPFATGEGYFYNKKTKIETNRTYTNPRNPYGKYKNPEPAPGEDLQFTKNLWQIPRIENADIYQDSNVAELRIVVRLKYTGTLADRTISEFCDVSSPISVMRESTLQQNTNKVIEDGTPFNILTKGDDKTTIVGFAKVQGENTSGQSQFTIKHVINDTLEVLAPAGETISFNIELRRDNEIKAPKTQVRVPNTSNNFAKTYYIPLSRYFNKNVAVGDTVTISDVSHNQTKFYYITDANTTTAVEQNQFKISEITRDVAYIDDASMIDNTSNSYSISKYYIMQGEYESAQGKVYSYRQTASYLVTGKVYKLVPDQNAGEIIFAMQPNSDNSVSLANWMGAFKLYKGTTRDGGAIKTDTELTTLDLARGGYLSFKIAEDVAQSSIGRATINPETGDIELLDKPFGKDSYIKVVISLKVSGKERNFNTSQSYKELATLNLGLSKN